MSQTVSQSQPNRIPTAEELGFDPGTMREKYAAERARRLRADANNQYQQMKFPCQLLDTTVRATAMTRDGALARKSAAPMRTVGTRARQVCGKGGLRRESRSRSAPSEDLKWKRRELPSGRLAPSSVTGPA